MQSTIRKNASTDNALSTDFCRTILLSPLSPPPFILTNHTPINLCIAGEGSEVGVLLPSDRSVDFDWSVLSRAVREKRGSSLRDGSPDSYWSRVEKTDRVSMAKEKRNEYRIALYTFYDYNQLTNAFDVRFCCLTHV